MSSRNATHESGNETTRKEKEQAEAMESYDREFWHFSDQLRLQTAGLSALSLGDSIWSPAADRRANADQGAAGLFGASPHDAAKSVTNFNDPTGGPGLIGSGKLAFGATKADRYNNNNLPADHKSNSFNNNGGAGYGKNVINNNNNAFGFNKMGSYGYNTANGNGSSGEVKSYFNKSAGRPANNNNNNNHAGGHKKGDYGGGRKKQGRNGDNNNGAAATDKRFKTLPAAEALPRGEPVGGYIFVCNNDTMDENLRRELFGNRFLIQLCTSLTS